MAATFDTYIELLPADKQSVQVGTYTFGFDKTIGVKGFQKLINRWAKAFLTLEGTDLSDANYGTQFPALIGSNISDRAEIQEVVRVSISQANEILLALQADNPPPNDREALQDAELVSLIFEADGLGFEASVLISNQAGEVLQLLLPAQPTG